LINTYLDSVLDKSYFINFLKISIFSLKKNNEVKESKYWWEETIDFNTAWKDNTWPEFDKQIREMNKLLKKQSAKLIVVIFPIGSQINYDSEAPDFDYIVKPQGKVTYYCNKHNIPVLDLFTYFQEHNNLSLYEDGLHLSSYGHSLSGEIIEEFILENL
jgi:hypothetical protein